MIPPFLPDSGKDGERYSPRPSGCSKHLAAAAADARLRLGQPISDGTSGLC